MDCAFRPPSGSKPSPRRDRASHLDRGRHRHSWSQLEVRLPVQDGLDRQALNDLDVVARRVFGWQQAERSPTARLNAVDMAWETFAVGVDAKVCRQARMHVYKLRFAKVRRHPYVERNDEHECLANRGVSALG